MPDSDPAREVNFGIKTGAFYGQEGVALRARQVQSYTENPVQIISGVC